jgi:hypothetical protein
MQTYDDSPVPARNLLAANPGYINPYALNLDYSGMPYGYPSNWFMNPYYGNECVYDKY